MLLNNFYIMLQEPQTEDNINWKIAIRLDPTHALYQGHFPGRPIVPGVCILQLIKECVEYTKKQSLQYAQVSSCKFLSAINPEENSRVEMKLTLKTVEENKLQLQAEGTTSGNCFIKLKAILIRR